MRPPAMESQGGLEPAMRLGSVGLGPAHLPLIGWVQGILLATRLRLHGQFRRRVDGHFRHYNKLT